ncbi:Uncharacterized protein Adt_49179 [Abeliophyllum distichum]|uniref:Transposase MuDR plant domain-containing protein n=1 Tax=Abeliophyllum distichum TaxID=126358 RepID=A0ABD1NNX7_9LAMI
MIPKECTYTGLVKILFKELNKDPTKCTLSLQYQVMEKAPLLKINNNYSVAFYLNLKENERGVTKFPIFIDVLKDTNGEKDVPNLDVITSSDGDIGVGNLILLKAPIEDCLNYSSLEKLPTIEDMARKLCENIFYPKEMFSGSESNVISHPSIEVVSKSVVFKDKEVLVTSVALYAMSNRFQYRVYKSYRSEYVLKCLDGTCNWCFRSSNKRLTSMFKITNMATSHTCSMGIIIGDCR